MIFGRVIQTGSLNLIKQIQIHQWVCQFRILIFLFAYLSILIQAETTMRLKNIIKIVYSFSSKSTPFEHFISSPKKELTLKRNAGRNSIGSQIHVPHARVDRKSVEQFFESRELKGKNILLNIDSSHLMGMKRVVSLDYMNANVYKGYGEAVNILSKQNPSSYVQTEELAFNENIFALTDPLFIERANGEKTDLASLFGEIQAYYNSHLERGVERFQQEYLVPPQYLYLLETAYNLGNRIYFIGLNEYELRQIINSHLTLTEIKILFMESLKHCRATDGNAAGKSEAIFHHRSKEMLWKLHYSFLQPINYQLLHKLRKEIKGYCFAHPFHFLQPDNPSIRFRDLKDKEPDNSKLEKNAILSVLFGNLWSKPYTNNPFPYLAESFPSLAPEDKKLVTEIYNSFYNKYKSAQEKYLNHQ